MDVETPPKCVNWELNSQFGIRSQDSHFSQSDEAPPTTMLLWGVAHYVIYINMMQVTVYAHKGLIEQQGAAMPLYSRSIAAQRTTRLEVWHCHTGCNSTD